MIQPIWIRVVVSKAKNALFYDLVIPLIGKQPREIRLNKMLQPELSQDD